MKWLSIAFVCFIALGGTQSKVINNDLFTASTAGNRPITLQTTGVDDLKEGLAPYQCSLQKNSKHFCSCVIIAPEWVLTAAHCISSIGKRVQDVQILVGTNKLSDGGSYYRAKQIFPHNKFNKPQFEEPESGQLQYANDIALIQTESSIKFNAKVYPIAVSDKVVNVASENVEKLQITAWPTLNENGDRSDTMKVLNVTIISAEECKRHSAVGTAVNSTLCTITPANKLIYGDAGGPLVHMNDLVGIANWVEATGPRTPEGFANIAYHYKWIENIIGPLSKIMCSIQTTNDVDHLTNIYNFCKNMTTILKDKIVGPNGIIKS